MKIFGYKIIKQERLEKIASLLRGNQQDIEIAESLLTGKIVEQSRKFKLCIEKDAMYLWFCSKKGSWDILTSSRGNYTNKDERDKGIQKMKNYMEENPEPFEKMELFY